MSEDIRLVLVAGSRDWGDHDKIWSDLYREKGKANSLGQGMVVVHGACRGADASAESWCDHTGTNSVKVPARWRKQGKSAGPIRNSLIAALFKFDAILSYPLGDSKGTADMVRKARAK